MSRRSKKSAKENLSYRASEELYQALFAQAADGIFIADEQGHYVEVNQRGCEMLGYTREELLALSVKDLIPDEDLTHDPLQLDELRAGKALLKERRLRCKDGRLLPVEISVQMLADGSLLGIARDITERKKAEAQLRESNERFRLLAESSLTGIYLIQESRFSYVNPAMAHTFGYEVEEITDKLGPMDLVYPDDRHLVADNIRRRVEGEADAIHYDFRGLRKDGSVIYVDVHGGRIEYGGKTGVIGTLVDITERKQADEALRASEERLQMALDAAQMGQWDWNIVTGEVTWSPQCLALYGLPPDTQMSHERFLQILHPDDREHIDKALRRAVEECAGYDEQKCTIWPDGSIHWTASRGKVYYDDMDRPVRMVGVSFDITKWKEAEKEHQTHLWFLESLDRINLAMQGTNDIEQMMSNVLDTMLSIFDCDRAWLVYPCDPEAAKWQVQMERTRPEYPGVLPIGVELPLDPMGVTVFRILREAHGPVQFGPEAEHQVPVEMAKRFSLQSFIAMALYPKVGQPWSFGLHQCGYPRAWTPEEERLFQEIGRRLADSLTSLLAYRNLRESERKLAEAERIAHVGWWDRDYVADSITLSDEACRIFGLPFEEQGHDLARWHERWKALIHPDDRAKSAQAAEAALQGGPRYDVEYRVVRPDGEVRFVRSQGDVTWDDSGQPRRMFGIMQDITELRQVEDELRHNREAAIQFSKQLATLQDVTNQLSKAETSNDLCRQAVQLGRSSLGFDRVSIWFIDEDQGIMQGSFGTDEHGELRDERNAQVTFRHEGLAWRVFSQKESMALVEYGPLHDHLSQKVGDGDNAIAALWDGDEVIGVISVDNFFTHQPITEHSLEVLRLYATALGHLITRNRAEEARRASEARFRTLVNHATDAFFLHADDGTVLDVNRQACQSLGYTREELIGMSPYEFDAGEMDHASIDQMTARLDAGEVITIDTRHRRKDGNVFPVEVRVRPFWQDKRRFAVSLARDITERKQAQEALTLFRTLIDYTNDAIEVIDPETGRFLDANEQAYGTLGYTREEFLALSVPEINPIAAERPWQALMDEFRHSGSQVRESQRRRKDGSNFPVEVNINYIRLDRDYVLAVARDITDRKQAEEALRASEERYRALYLDNPSMFFTLDSNGVVISVNAFGASQLGYTIDELEGQSVLNVIYKDDQTAVKTQLQRCVQTPGYINQWQFRKVRKDGSQLWVEEFARAVTDPNGTIHVLIVCQDITDRKQVEMEQKRLLAKIQEQAQQVQNIIDTVPEGVILLSKDQVITLTNPLAREYLTLLEPELENGRLTHLGNRPINELLTSPPKGLWHEIVNDGLVFDAVTRPVENSPENGGWVLVLRDITQERDIQQRVQRQERLASVGQLAAGIAHDFNNILAVILLHAQFIARTVSLPTSTQDQLHTIEQQAQRATALIRQILDFSRQSVVERQPLDLLPFMEKIVALLERTLPEHVRIELEYATDTFFIQADPTRIQQVIMNLAVNARDAMPEGGRLHIRLAHVQTEEPIPMPIQDLPPGKWIQIEVADSGNGIPPEMLSNIFEPFFTTKEEGQGTGLGLAQVYGIVQQHEGFIDVTTEVGQGTTFSLYFPALGTGKHTADMSDRAVLQVGQGQRILLVEDDPDTRQALANSLALLNYDVVEAVNGREALEILTAEAEEIKLVLSDTVMPEMGGIALYHAIREQKLNIPVVLLTGHPLSNEMENLQGLGLAGWLPKPTDLVTLSYLLAEALAVEPR